MRRTYDLAVIGGGTAGIIAAKTAGRLGARVVLVERDRTGGDCVWTGCVPSKSLIAAAHTAHRMRTADKFGITPVTPTVDIADVLAYVRKSIERIEPADSPNALRAAGAEVLHGTAEFTGRDEIRVDGTRLRFRRALIATGSFPELPPVPGLADVDPLTTDKVWNLTELPRRLAVLGGGPIGCELGQAFARLGAEVTIIEAAERLVPHEEPAASTALAAALTADGVRVLTGTTISTARRQNGTIHLELDGRTDTSPVVADQLLAATGRRPRSAGLGLDAAGVRVHERGHIAVDAALRTSNRRIYAAGDVASTLPFTHVAGMQGSIAATNALLAPVRRFTPDHVPWVTFTDPEIAHVGLTEAQARQRHGAAVRVRLLRHEHIDRAITEDNTDGCTHIVLDRRGKVLGSTVVAPRAGEMIAELTNLVATGTRLRDLASVIHPYPAWTDAIWNAAVAEAEDALSSPGMRRVSAALLRLQRIR